MVISARILGFWNTYSMIQIDWMAKNSLFVFYIRESLNYASFIVSGSYDLIPERRDGQIIWTKLESNSLQAAPLSIMPLPLEQPIYLFDQLDSWNFDKLCVDRWIDWLAQKFFVFPEIITFPV